MAAAVESAADAEDFEIVLPITVVVLDEEDFFQDVVEEPVAPLEMMQVKEEEDDPDTEPTYEPNLGNNFQTGSEPNFETSSTNSFNHVYYQNISCLTESITIPKVKEEAADFESILYCDNQPELPKERETAVGLEGSEPSKAGDGEASKKKNTLEEGSLSSPLEHDWNQELELTCNCSALSLCGYSLSEDLPKDVRKVEADASPCAEADPSEKDTDETPSVIPMERSRQHEVACLPLCPEERQSQQEGLGQLGDSVTIKSVCEASSPREKHEKHVGFFCRSCFFDSSNPRTFIQHLKGHKDPPPYLCPQCNEAFSSLSELLPHMYWHAGYRLFQCRCCTFSSFCLSSMVKHSYIPSRHESCVGEVCAGGFTSTLERHRRVHVGQETYKKFHGHLDTDGDTRQSRVCHTGRTGAGDGDSQCGAALSLSAQENNRLSVGLVSAGGDCEQAGDGWDNKTLCSGMSVPENSCESNSSPVPGDRPEVPLSSYRLNIVVCKDKPLSSSRASPLHEFRDSGFHTHTKKLEDTKPYNLRQLKTYRCQHCSYTTVIHSNLELHQEVHADEKRVERKDWHEAFKSSIHLQEHRFTHRKKGCKHGCCLCAEAPFSHPQRDQAQLGVQKVRGSDSAAPAAKRHRYICPECQYSTDSLGNLKMHLRTHTGERPYCCRKCKMKFRTSSHLKRHQLTHLTLAHLQCQHCDYSSSKWCSLKRHLASHSCGETSSSCFSCQREEPWVKIHTCEKCGYFTVRSENLKLHMRFHSSEKPFQCDQCTAAFCTSSQLRRHQVTHRKLRCTRCKFSTLDEQALRKHMESHRKKCRYGKCPKLLRSKNLPEEHRQQHQLEL